MAQTVIGVFDTQDEAQRAVNQLINNGFDRSRIDMAAQTDQNYTTQTTTRDRDDDNDGIGGFFRSLFGGDDDYDREKYTDVARRGTLVTVYTNSSDEAERAADVLDEYGAVNVDERYEQYRSDTTTQTTPSSDYVTTNTTGEQGGSVQVIEENLHIGKREVTTGGVRLRSRIVERPVEEHVRLREEHVRIERTPVNRPVTDADLATFQEGQIELIERAEVPVVEKEARVVEEISVGKEVSEREETVRDTVRNTEVDVEQIPGTETTQTRRTTNNDL